MYPLLKRGCLRTVTTRFEVIREAVKADAVVKRRQSALTLKHTRTGQTARNRLSSPDTAQTEPHTLQTIAAGLAGYAKLSSSYLLIN